MGNVRMLLRTTRENHSSSSIDAALDKRGLQSFHARLLGLISTLTTQTWPRKSGGKCAGPRPTDIDSAPLQNWGAIVRNRSAVETLRNRTWHPGALQEADLHPKRVETKTIIFNNNKTKKGGCNYILANCWHPRGLRLNLGCQIENVASRALQWSNKLQCVLL